jgi:vacuolar-type H+-ATPase subunit F/Vma7
MTEFLIAGGRRALGGFRVAGFTCLELTDKENVDSAVESLMAEGRYGLVFVERERFDAISDRVMRRARKRGLPVILPIDVPTGWGAAGTSESHLARLIRRAVGYQIKIKR